MALQGQWADSLLEFERLHLLKLTLWGSLCVAVGVVMLTALRFRHPPSALLKHFAIQTTAWGVVDLAIVFWAHRRLALRDLDAAVALDRFVWLNVGLDLGYVAVGLTLAVLGWKLGRRLGIVGAGVGVIVQGLALAVLDLQLAATIIR